MKLTLRQLQVFDAVAKHGSVTGAAKHLGMSQSTVSSTLKDLQIILQRPLFTSQSGRVIRMTDEGKRLKVAIRSALVGVEEVEREALDGLPGRLHIGASEFVSEAILPALCVRYQQRHPNVEMTIETHSAKHLFEKIGRLDLDLIVIEIYPEIPARSIHSISPELEILKWKTDDLQIVAVPEHPLAGRMGIELGEVATWPWCIREAEATYSQVLRSLFRLAGPLRTTFVCTSEKTMRLIALEGGGLACLSSRMVAQDIELGKLVRLDVRDFAFKRSICLVRPTSVRRPRIAIEFDRFLQEQDGSESD